MYKRLTRDKVDKIWSIFEETYTGGKNNRYPCLIRGIAEIRKRIDSIPSSKIKQCPRHFGNIRKYLLLNPSLYIIRIYIHAATLCRFKRIEIFLRNRIPFTVALIYSFDCNEINFNDKSWYTKMLDWGWKLSVFVRLYK